jgi:hypothetical protein
MTLPRVTDRWRKSSYSAEQTNCVEVALGDGAKVRDTKDRSSSQLTVSTSAWRSFATNVKRNH